MLTTIRKLFPILPYIAVILLLGGLAFVAFSSRPQPSQPSQPAGSAPLLQPYPEPEQPYPEPKSPTPAPTMTAPPFIPSPTPLPTIEADLPTGAKIVYGQRQEGRLTFWAASASDTSLRKIIATTPFSVAGYNGTMSPNQQYIALAFSPSPQHVNARLADLAVFDIRSQEFTQIATEIKLGRPLNYPVWSNNSEYIAVLRQSEIEFPYTQTVSIINIQTGAETILAESAVQDAMSEGSEMIYPLGWSADDQYLYIQKGSYSNVELWRYDVKQGDSSAIGTIAKAGIPRCYYISPKGTHLLCLVPGDEDTSFYTLGLMSTETGAMETLYDQVARGTFSDPLWSASGNQIVLSTTDEAAKQPQSMLISPSDKSVQSMNVNALDTHRIASWSPDEAWMVARDSNIVDSYAVTSYIVVNLESGESHDLAVNSDIKIMGWLDTDSKRQDNEQ